MTITTLPTLSYIDRLTTFADCWPPSLEPTTRQLAATGHICDRPPLEALEEGSHCITCNKFVKREDSVSALQSSLFGSNQESCYQGLKLHHAACTFLQNRIPIDAQSIESDLRGGQALSAIRNLWERRSKPQQHLQPTTHRHPQPSTLFSLPTELRLQIYSQIMPSMDRLTPITTLSKQSIRIVTEMGFSKTGPRDMTKINLLSTCRAVHEEALDILFTNTTYKFESTKLLYLFLRHIGEHGRALLKYVDVACGDREDPIAFSLLASCPKLKGITIRLRRPVLILPGSPLWLLDGVACLLELSGLEKVTFGECKVREGKLPKYLDESKADAAIVRRELTRPKGSPGGVRWVDGHLDI
ncbi:hypothetical protein PRZ48_009734 [Zasmidium cellare]|uniref:F-box domain-containing protein n=1 Tax=Zasmidium cellare TaxID=395010 RepID=A0ABR0ED79_ZASCE|nr:hypothetical protein PRZ48_009734 [Zasmidium cellare]